MKWVKWLCLLGCLSLAGSLWGQVCNRKSDSLELVKLYNATDGPNWVNKWDLKKPISGWYGVKLNEQGCITGLTLSSNKLAGNIPDFNLPDLELLNLNYNQLTGNIPNFTLPNLRVLNLSNNRLSGSIPQFNLPNLGSLSLAYNQLSGSIPNFNSISLYSLSLNNNQLTGNIPILNEKYLYRLNLSHNQLVGNIPNFKTRLQSLILNNNKLSGTIPVFNFDRLEDLDLSNNELSGNIPKFNVYWYSAEKIDFSNNKLTGGSDTLTLPNVPIVNLSNNLFENIIFNTGSDRVIELNLSHNKLVKFPNITPIKNLRILDLTYNYFKEEIPTFNHTALYSLDLSNCMLTGNISNLNLPSLQRLILKNNNLTGTLPRFNLMTVLTSLDVSFNQLSGAVPDFNFRKLTHFNIDHNQISTLPGFSQLLFMGKVGETTDSLIWRNNLLTFDDIIPNLNLINTMKGKSSFVPQDSFYRDTVIYFKEGQSLAIDLGIDASIADNKYNWTKDKTPYQTITGSNKLNFTSIKSTDAGIYHVQVTNPRVPSLTLNSHKIRIGVAPVKSDTNSCRYQDSLTLVKLYNATNGPNWTNKWDLRKPMSEWYGVEVNGQGCVISLLLYKNKLRGTIPNFNLPNLQILHLYTNQLSGNVPDFDLPNLTSLDLSENQLRENIPDFNLPNLTSLDLSENQLNGNIPDFNLPNLTSLDLSENQLRGNIPNFNLPNLTKLYLYKNQLIGNISNFDLPNLEVLWLSENQLSGNIPNFNLPKLKSLYLYTNQLSGSIPNFNLPDLTKLYLYKNQLIGNIFNFDLPNLEVLWLSENQLSGNIPNFNLPKLKSLYLYSNQLSGSIPNFDLPNLEILWLSENQLSGDIPNFNLPNLTSLSLNKNQLSGKIPNFNLPKLILLNIRNNQLSSSIPNFNLPILQSLLLSNNQLNGSIPNFNLPELLSLELSNNKLTHFSVQTGSNKFGDTSLDVDSLTLQKNQFTFDDIIPNINLINKMGAKGIYTPQDSIYRDTTIRITEGKSLTIDLGTDATIPDNQYIWTKNGQAYKTITGNNKLAFAPIALTDAGTYSVRVTNPRAPLLTLYGRKIKIEVMPSCRKNDSLELVKVYNATGGPTWNNKWDLSKPINTWYGVSLNTEGCVTFFNLANNNLKGTLPALSFSKLNHFFLENNQLSGTIPELNMPELIGLRLFNNQLSGSIPNFQMPNLLYLLLSNNQLSGSLPHFDLPNLLQVMVANNKLSGEIPNFTMPKLEVLHLYNNQFSGTISDFRLPALTDLVLYDNQLSGSIPNFNLPNLSTLNLAGNQLSGSIPNFTMPNLVYFLLHNNQLSGSIPNFNMPKLFSMSLYGNKLSGSLPDFSNLVKLEILHLHLNQLSGPLPNFKLPSVKEIVIHSNQLTGSIPNFDTPNLFRLNLSNNQLSGSIPNFNLPNLNYLLLQINQLSGNIPSFKLPKLILLALFDNKLSGSLPDFQLPSLAAISVQNNRMTFAGIVPYAGFISRGIMSYFPQDSILRDTIIQLTTGASLSFDSAIDSQLSTNSYKWTKGGASHGNTLNTNKLTINDLKLSDAGTYRVQVTNPAAPALALYSKAIRLKVSCANNPIAKISSSAPKDTICPNTALTLTASGGSSYKWSTGQTTSSININVTQSQNFQVTITDTYSCTTILSKNLVQDNPPTASITTLPRSICPGKTLTLDAQPQSGATFQWQRNGNNIGTASTQSNIQITQSGTYTVQVINALKCKASSAGVIIKDGTVSKAEISANSQVVCPGGSLALNASTSPNALYEWLRNGSSVQGPNTISTYSATQAGNYTLKVTSADDCEATSSAYTLTSSNLASTARINSSSSRDTLCPNTSLILTAAGGNSYKWSTGQSTASINLTVTQNQNYQVTITDANNCSTTLSKNIVQAPLPPAEISALDNRICKGGNIELRAPAQAKYQYEWFRNGQSLGNASNSNTYKATQTGLYTVKVINQYGCYTLSKEFDLQEGVLPKAEISATSNIICSGGKLSLNAVPVDGAQYQWLRNGSSVQGPSSSSTYEATQEGSYTLRVILVSGCAGNSTPFVVQGGGSGVRINLSPLRDTICAGDSLKLSVSGGLRYTWSTNSVSSAITVRPPQTTLYTVTVEDPGNCKVTLSQNIVVVRVQAQITLKEEDCRFTLVGAATGGRSPYTYRWNNGHTQAQLLHPKIGTYNLQVRDQRNCLSNATIRVDSFSIMAGPPIHFDANCGETNGQIELKLRPDRGDYFIEWSPADQGTGDIIRTGLGPGDYTAIILDGQGCMDTVKVRIDKAEDCNKDFLIYPSITPNRDKANDTFVIKPKQSGVCPSGKLNDCYPNNELFIFNRWGEVLYRKQGYESDWDAEGLPGGAYYFIFYPDRNTSKGVTKGTLTVLK